MDSPTAHGLLNVMCRIRAFEECVSELVASGDVQGLVHLSIGQEGVAAGVCAHLRPSDYLFTGHRGHGHHLAKGGEVARTMAELMGRSTGLCRGKGGSMHLVQVEAGQMGATGVVGGNVPLALGAALAQQERRSGGVTAVFFGDGAVQAGHFHESLNLASLWHLPVLLVCENNGYAEFTPRSAHTNVERVTQVAEPYGIPTCTVDGNDVTAVFEAAGTLIEDLRGGQGPALMECLTYRLRGHYEGDPSQYRQAVELEEWKDRDPIRRLTSTGEREGWLSADDLCRSEREAAEAINAAVEFARGSPWPAPEELLQDVYA